MAHNPIVANNESDFEFIKEEHLSNDKDQLIPTEAELWLNEGVVKEDCPNKQTYEKELSWNGVTNCVVKVEVEIDPLDLRQPDSVMTSEDTVAGSSSPNTLQSDLPVGTNEKHEVFIKTEKMDPEISEESYLFTVIKTEKKENDLEDVKNINIEVKGLSLPSSRESHIADCSNLPGDHIVNTNIKYESNRDSNFNCSECEYRKITSGIVKKHPTLYDTDREIACKSCGVKYDTKQYSDNSVNVSEPIYLCDICQYKCTNKRNLRTHLREHGTGVKKPYACSFCPKKYGDCSSLKIHLRSHTGVKPYACTLCDRRYARKSLLKSHLSMHTGEKPFSCTYCEFRCSIGYLLKRHLKKHTDGKPYNCTYCDYRCSQSRILKAHLKTHTGDKPFICVYCKYSCSRSADLKIHLRTHTGEKPFSCTHCEYKCCRSDQLRRHVRTHTGEKAYPCPYCQYGCSRKRLLNQHLLKHTELTS